jgi:hypothetical protein
MTTTIAAEKDDLLDAIFGRKLLSRSMAGAAFEEAERQSDLHANRFAPNSVYGMVSGITSLSRQSSFGDKRVELDTAAGKLLQMEF